LPYLPPPDTAEPSLRTLQLRKQKQERPASGGASSGPVAVTMWLARIERAMRSDGIAFNTLPKTFAVVLPPPPAADVADSTPHAPALALSSSPSTLSEAVALLHSLDSPFLRADTGHSLVASREDVREWLRDLRFVQGGDDEDSAVLRAIAAM